MRTILPIGGVLCKAPGAASSGNLKPLERQSDLQSKQLQMVFAKYGQASLKITPASPLAPGEYAIAAQTRDQQPTAYCFGIDAASK
jgi:hypothetical protein